MFWRNSKVKKIKKKEFNDNKAQTYGNQTLRKGRYFMAGFAT